MDRHTAPLHEILKNCLDGHSDFDLQPGSVWTVLCVVVRGEKIGWLIVCLFIIVVFLHWVFFGSIVDWWISHGVDNAYVESPRSITWGVEMEMR